MNENNTNNEKGKSPISLFLVLGLLLEGIYFLVKHFYGELPDVVSNPWMIISCGMMLVGIYTTVRNMKR